MYVVLNQTFYNPHLLENHLPKKDCWFPEVNIQIYHQLEHPLDDVNDYNVYVLFYGSLYNEVQLKTLLGITSPLSVSKLIISLYLQFGMKGTLRLLNGDYSLILLDYHIHNTCSILYVARNPMGTRPLYKYTHPMMGEHNLYMFSNSLHKINPFWELPPNHTSKKVELVENGTYHMYHLSNGVSPKWNFVSENKYFTFPLFNHLYTSDGYGQFSPSVKTVLEQMDVIMNDIIHYMCNNEPSNKIGIVDVGDIGSKLADTR